MIALAGGGYLYFRLDDEICRHVEQRCASHYQHHQVHVGAARFEQGRGVFVNKLSLQETRENGSPRSVLEIDELFLACDARLDELLSGKPHVDRIVVRRPQLRAVRLVDGRWNVAALVPLPKFSDDTPEMLIEDATLILEDATRPSAAPFSLRGIDLKITPGENATAGGQRGSRCLLVSGTATGTPARELAFSGSLCPGDGTLDITFDIHSLQISPELMAAIPGTLPTQLDEVVFHASADAKVTLTQAKPGGREIFWSAQIALNRGRLNHKLLPQPLTELKAEITADSHTLAIKQLTGKVAAADVTIACNRQGWSADAPLALAGRIKGLLVDSELRAVLPARVEQLWQRFSPEGIVDADIQLTFDGQHWRPVLTAQCRGLSLTDHEKFPYPIVQATGTVAISPSPSTGATQFELDLVGMGDGRPIRIAAKIDHLAVPSFSVKTNGGAAGIFFDDEAIPNRGVQLASTAANPSLPLSPTGWVEVSGEGVSVHEELLAAMPEKVEKFVRTLHAQGLVDFRWRYQRTNPYADNGNADLELRLTDCAIQYEKFPYPLQQVRGFVTAHNGHFKLSDIVGRDRQGSAVVNCFGESHASSDGLALQLTIHGTGVPLDENLKHSVSPAVQQVWDELRPLGRVNFTARVDCQVGQEKPTTRVSIQPFENTVSIEPTFFPYRLEQVSGQAIVTDGRVDLQQLYGIHGRTNFSAQVGVWQADAGGGWQLFIQGLNADRLAFEPDFLRAVPLAVQKVIDRIRPTGNFNVNNSQLLFVRRPDSHQIAAKWDIRLAGHQSALRGDLPLENLSGNIRVQGDCDGPNCRTYGELAIDSLIWNDIQFTNIHGPFWSDSSVCHFGKVATEKLGQSPRRLNADVFGGTIASDVLLEHTGQPRYNAEISIGGVDLSRVVRERMGGPSDLTGKVSGKLSLRGTGRSTYALSGQGDLHVVDANIYQLPPLVAMLSVLRNRTPDTTAFNRCDMEFDIRGEHIHFKKLDLLGDAVSLYGRGETNFDRRLNLVFYTLVGPADLPIPLWKTVAGHLSEQGFQLKVDGTWDNPQIHREAFPAVSKMLEQAGQGASAVAPPAAAGIPWITPPKRY